MSTAATSLHHLGHKLGIPRLRSERELAALAERRLPAESTVEALVSGGLSKSEVYRLIAPRRFLVRHATLTPEQTDRAIRAARIAVLAEKTFADQEKAWRWLRKPKRQFGGKSPVEMLTNETGGRLVEELLLGLEYGVTA